MTTPGTPEVYSQKLVNSAKARKFVSQHGRGYMAIGIFDGDNNPVDPEPSTLKLQVWLDLLDGAATDPRGALVVDVDTITGIVRDDVGKYHYDIGPQWTANRGLLTAEWTYEASGNDFVFQDNMQIMEQMPFYDQMREEAKLLVEQTSWFFADMFDSETGGPWLGENFQTHFTYDRIAFLMGQGLMKLNLTGYPVTAYGVTVDEAKLPKEFNQLAIWATKLEAIRHLVTSYTEQPDFRNMTTTYTDRRDYAERWRAVLADEKDDFKQAVKMAKRGLLNLGRGSLLVSGGIYGSSARGFFMPGIYANQTRSFRMYPAAPSIAWPSFGRT